MASLIGETVTLTVNYSVFADTLVNVDVYTGTFVVGAGVELSGQAISVTFTSGGFPQTLTGTISANIGANTMSVNFTGTQQAGGLSFILSSVANQSAGNISAVTQTAASGFTPGVNQPLDPSFDNLTNGTVTAGFFPLGFQPGVNLNQTVSFTLNDPVAPTLGNLNGDAANYTQGGPAVNIDVGNNFSITDPDAPSALSGNQSMLGAVITITDFVAGDLLSFTLSGGITATFVNGVLTLSGLGSRSEYRAVIRSITFSSTSGDPTVGGTDLIRNITTTVTDASGLTSTPSLSTVNITGLPNTPPVVNFNTGLTLNEGGSAAITAAMLDFNDAEQGDGAITYTITTAATNGTLFNNGVALGVGGTFTQANLNAGLITYTHNGSETVGALFQFTVSDGAGGSVPGQSFNFTINPINDAPAFTGDLTASVAEGGTVAITLADLNENDPDDSGTGLVYTITGTVNGQVELSSNPGVAITSFTQQDLANGLVVFVHNGSETVTGSFSFSLADGGENGVSPATGTVNIAVTPVDDPTSAVDDTFSTDEATAIGAGLNVFNANPTTADSDSDSTLTVTEVNGVAASVGIQITLASGALLTLNANGTFSYDPNGVFNALGGPISGASNTSATDSFTYTTVGGDTATVTINVAGLDSADSLQGTAGADSLNAGIDNDELRGFDGADTFQGGTGNDVMFNIDNGVGDSYFGGADFDTVSYAEDLGPVTINLANVALNGGAAANDVYNGVEAFVGSDFADTMIGNVNGNIFDGGDGVDSMQGGDGSDTYFADQFNDAVIETNSDLATGGNDLVNFTGSSGTFILGANVERLVLGGTFAINGTGNGLANTILGNGAANVISGGIQSDVLAGAGGDDTISGGDQGDELYGQAGADTLNGDGGNDILSGGDDGDTLHGGANSDQLMGGNGDDFLDGGTGLDVLTGGAGADTFYFSIGYQQDAVQGFTDDVDTLNLDDALWGGVLTVAQVIATFATQTAAGIVTFDFGGGSVLTVSNGAGITTAQLLDDITIV